MKALNKKQSSSRQTISRQPIRALSVIPDHDDVLRLLHVHHDGQVRYIRARLGHDEILPGGRVLQADAGVAATRERDPTGTE